MDGVAALASCCLLDPEGDPSFFSCLVASRKVSRPPGRLPGGVCFGAPGEDIVLDDGVRGGVVSLSSIRTASSTAGSCERRERVLVELTGRTWDPVPGRLVAWLLDSDGVVGGAASICWYCGPSRRKAFLATGTSSRASLPRVMAWILIAAASSTAISRRTCHSARFACHQRLALREREAKSTFARAASIRALPSAYS